MTTTILLLKRLSLRTTKTTKMSYGNLVWRLPCFAKFPRLRRLGIPLLPPWHLYHHRLRNNNKNNNGRWIFCFPFHARSCILSKITPSPHQHHLQQHETLYIPTNLARVEITKPTIAKRDTYECYDKSSTARRWNCACKCTSGFCNKTRTTNRTTKRRRS